MPKVVQTERHTVAVANTLLTVIVAASLWACTTTNPSTIGERAPVNTVEVSERLVTSGQLTANQISELDPVEYRIVINLAPNDGDMGFQHEARLLASKEIAYLAIPVDIQQPDYQDFILFSSALEALENGRAWVHCRVNNRASVFAFLYRVIYEGIDPDTAYEKVTQVWVPTAHWLKFARETLANHNIAYDF